jgi:hypothetical protein
MVDTAYTGAFYTGVHNDASGNVLAPPQNGFGGTFNEAAALSGDTRYPNRFAGGADVLQSGVYGLRIDGQKYQSFCIQFFNQAGTIRHASVTDSQAAGATLYADRLTGASAALTNTPVNLDAANGFGATSLGLVAGSNHRVVLNTGAQTTGFHNLQCDVPYYDGNNTRVRVDVAIQNVNVNGATLLRPVLAVTNDMTGAAVNIDTTLLPASKSLFIRVRGFIS